MTEISKRFDEQDDTPSNPPSPWTSDAARRPAKRRPRRWWKGTLIALPLAGLGLWIAVHRLPWLGPAIADGLRAVVGVEAVTALEDFAYAAQDRFNRLWRSDEAPKAYWKVPPQAVAPPPPVKVGQCELPAFHPEDVGPVHEEMTAEGDGQWVPISDPRRPDEGPVLYKTLLHPDAKRSWTAVSIVAIDLRQVNLHLVAGRYEPAAETAEGRKADRPGLVPAEHRPSLLAAFNGGFKAEHGHYGMAIGGHTLLRPRKRACQIVLLPSGEIRIGDAEKTAELREEATWWRQTPQCMLESGELHPGLRSEDNTYWGATLDGKTVIRRSAVGISADGETLYSGIGDHTSARAIAVAMKHAGAADVAQLDVNWSYPKFVLYEPEQGQLMARELCDGFELSEDEYVRQPSDRDFFYLTREDDAPCAPEPGTDG